MGRQKELTQIRRSSALPFHNTNPRTHTKVSPDSWFPLSGCVCHTTTLLLAISDSSPIYIPSNQHMHPRSIHTHTPHSIHTHTHHTQFTHPPTHHTQSHTHTHTPHSHSIQKHTSKFYRSQNSHIIPSTRTNTFIHFSSRCTNKNHKHGHSSVDEFCTTQESIHPLCLVTCEVHHPCPHYSTYTHAHTHTYTYTQHTHTYTYTQHTHTHEHTQAPTHTHMHTLAHHTQVQ